MLCCKFLNFRETKSEKIANPPTEEEGPAGIKSPFNTTGQIRDSRDSANSVRLNTGVHVARNNFEE